MDDYAGRVLADRYRLPRPPADEFELVETRAFDTYSGQEVLVRQVLLPEVVSADPYDSPYGAPYDAAPGQDLGASARRALDAARAAAAIPDHPRLVQVFDIFTDAGSLWVVSELVPARPLAALLAEKPLSPYRAAEVAADVLTALRAVHAHGWTHRNVTSGTVLVCDDGRAMLGGLAVGAAQEALSGYDPVPGRIPAMAGGGDEQEPQDSRGWGGPESPLEWERARQARITVVGAVTERWAPEQATEIQDSWRLAPPVGPAADLWALGSLLYRSVQGHPPFPEENAAELVQLVCSEPPAFAEECGPLRPVVESLLRQDPGERPDPEEIGGWLRSLVRSAPEPDLGLGTVPLPSEGPHRLPVVRRRGEVVRRRKVSAEAVPVHHGRHKRARERGGRGGGRSPRSLGLTLVGLVLLLLAAVVVYAVLFMPRATQNNGDAAGAVRTVPAEVGGGEEQPDAASSAPATPTSAAPTTSRPAASSAATPTGVDGDFRIATDPAGFSLAVPAGWQRHGKNAKGQVTYTGADFTLTVVPGRDSVADFGSDPLAYQSDSEAELDAFHASDWSSVFGARTLELNGNSAAEGEYTWRDGSGRTVYARNLAVLIDGKYHVILVTGPQADSADVKRYFEKAAETYRAG